MASRSNVPSVIALRAQQHRATLTESEQLLWSHINGCQLGVWFRRQVPIGNFIVDFLAPSVRIVVEVDGGYHRARRAADARRDTKLTRMGYRVIRLDSAMVYRHIGAALECICKSLAQQ